MTRLSATIMLHTTLFLGACLAFAHAGQEQSSSKRGPDGTGEVRIDGELKQWHKVTLSLDGPFAHELDDAPNPFVDYRMTVTFTHESGSPRYEVPGYFAADGDAGNSSSDSGTTWRAHLAPDKPGTWTYRVSFVRGDGTAVNSERSGQPVAPFNGKEGRLTIRPTDKQGRDFRGSGRLEYVGAHYLRFAGSGEYFLKAGPDAPETLLAYVDFDGTETRKVPLKDWAPHVRDWREGDPTWKDGKGRGLIGAANYLAAQGCNTFPFLTYNAGGDGENVWPHVSHDDKLHYDCSKLDQWQVVFDHAQTQGLYLHFKMQEQENDDNRKGNGEGQKTIAASLNGGDLGTERKLYCRELIARFGYELALNWNLGEENTQSAEQQRAMAEYLRDTDPYDHHIVVHTFPNAQDSVYAKLLGNQSVLTGASLQNSWNKAHERTLKWVTASREAGRPWVVANDEQGPASHGVPPDPDYEGFGNSDAAQNTGYDLHDIRKQTLWGTLLAGGAGVEYYFGYQLPQNDLVCQDFRSRERSWGYCRVALEFFGNEKIPFWEMTNADQLAGGASRNARRYCLAKPGSVYLVYLPEGGTADLDLGNAEGQFDVRWFNARTGGKLAQGSVTEVAGGGRRALGAPPADPSEDWLVVVRRR